MCAGGAGGGVCDSLRGQVAPEQGPRVAGVGQNEAMGGSPRRAEAGVDLGCSCLPGQHPSDSHDPLHQRRLRARLLESFIVLIHSPRGRLLETPAPGVPHRHRPSARLLQGHQEGHHPRPDEEGRSRGLHSPASAGWTQEVPSGATEKQPRPPGPAGRGRPQRGAPGGVAAAREQRGQALVVGLLHVAQPAQAALAPQVLGAPRAAGEGPRPPWTWGSWPLIPSCEDIP